MAEAQVQQAPTAPAEEQSIWMQEGFLQELARVCEGLEHLQEEHLYGPQIRQIIDSITNAKTVEDFSAYDDQQLYDFINQLRNNVPRIEREVTGLMGQINRARAVAIEVDFI